LREVGVVLGNSTFLWKVEGLREVLMGKIEKTCEIPIKENEKETQRILSD
jgi:hypothetical protein